MSTTTIPARLSFSDLVKASGGTPEAARPVIFREGSHQFAAPGVYASDPLSSKKVYSDEVDAMYEMVEHTEHFQQNGFDDVAVAVTRVLRSCDGGVTRSVKTSPFRLPSERSVPIGYDQHGQMRYETVPGDWMTIPGMDGQCMVGRNRDGSGYVNFQFRRYAHDAIKGFLFFIRSELHDNSIYRGQIIDCNYQFINVTGFDPSQLVYNDDIAGRVEMSCVSPIRDLEVLTQVGERAHWSVLLSGQPGTGKTMLTKLAMSLLFDRGFGGVVIPAGSDPEMLERAVKIARSMMRPDNIIGVFAEDVEKMAEKHRSLLLDVIDGPQSKSDRLIFFMTTNYAEQIQEPAFWRQGRVDDFIEVATPDRKALERIIRLRLDDRLAPDVDFDKVFEAYVGFTPAWIVGGMSRVLRAVIARTRSSENISVTTSDLVNAARSMSRQSQMASVEKEEGLPTIDSALRDVVYRAMEKVRAEMYFDVNDPTDYDEVQSRAYAANDGVTVNLRTESGKPITGELSV